MLWRASELRPAHFRGTFLESSVSNSARALGPNLCETQLRAPGRAITTGSTPFGKRSGNPRKATRGRGRLGAIAPHRRADLARDNEAEPRRAQREAAGAATRSVK